MYQHPEHPWLFALWPLSDKQLPTRFSELPAQPAPLEYLNAVEISRYTDPNGDVTRQHLIRNMRGVALKQHTETIFAPTGSQNQRHHQQDPVMTEVSRRTISAVNTQDTREVEFMPGHVPSTHYTHIQAQPDGVGAIAKRKAPERNPDDPGPVEKIAEHPNQNDNGQPDLNINDPRVKWPGMYGPDSLREPMTREHCGEEEAPSDMGTDSGDCDED